MKVVDDLGRTWYVSRRWIAWRPRIADDWVPEGGHTPRPPSEADEPRGLRLALYWLAAACFFLLDPLFRTITILLGVGERTLLALTLPFVVVGRVLLRRPWHVEVRHHWTRMRAWEAPAGDWAASRESIAAQAELLRRGEHPAQELVEPPRKPVTDAVPGGRRARRAQPDD